MLGMIRYIPLDGLIVDPQPAEFRLAAKDDRLHSRWRRALIVLEAHGQIDFLARLGPRKLTAKIVSKVIGIAPEVAMDVDDGHGAFPELQSILHAIRVMLLGSRTM